MLELSLVVVVLSRWLAASRHISRKPKIVSRTGSLGASVDGRQRVVEHNLCRHLGRERLGWLRHRLLVEEKPDADERHSRKSKNDEPCHS